MSPRDDAASQERLIGTVWEQANHVGFFTIARNHVKVFLAEGGGAPRVKIYSRYIFSPDGKIRFGSGTYPSRAGFGAPALCKLENLPDLIFPDDQWATYTATPQQLVVTTKTGKEIAFRPFTPSDSKASANIDWCSKPQQESPEPKCRRCGPYCCYGEEQLLEHNADAYYEKNSGCQVSALMWSANLIGNRPEREFFDARPCPVGVVENERCAVPGAVCYLTCTGDQPGCYPSDPRFHRIFPFESRDNPLNYPAKQFYKGDDYRKYVRCLRPGACPDPMGIFVRSPSPPHHTGSIPEWRLLIPVGLALVFVAGYTVFIWLRNRREKDDLIQEENRLGTEMPAPEDQHDTLGAGDGDHDIR